MSGPSLKLTRTPGDPAVSVRRHEQGTTWIGSWARLPDPPRHGCTVVRRITDDRGREWRVRQLWSENCQGLLFQCDVRGVRSEVRPVRGHLESLTDDELLVVLAPAED